MDMFSYTYAQTKVRTKAHHADLYVRFALFALQA